MKKLALIFAILFSTLMSASPSNAKWELIVTNIDGASFYVDTSKIRKHDGYVYWWVLVDSIKPTTNGFLSFLVYKESDCGKLRSKDLTFFFYKGPMASGTQIELTPKGSQADWRYPPPDSTDLHMLKDLCEAYS